MNIGDQVWVYDDSLGLFDAIIVEICEFDVWVENSVGELKVYKSKIYKKPEDKLKLLDKINSNILYCKYCLEKINKTKINND